jgi:hypothetical protein
LNLNSSSLIKATRKRRKAKIDDAERLVEKHSTALEPDVKEWGTNVAGMLGRGNDRQN